jgi:phage tail-like protein
MQNLIDRFSPFATFKFHVEIGSIIWASFSECSGLQMETEVFEYQEGGVNDFTHKFPGRMKQSNVTLKRGFTLSNELYLWFKQMQDALMSAEKVDLKNVSITLLNSAQPFLVSRWTLNEAFPVKWVGPNFKADEAAIAVESLEFAHHGIRLG